MLRLYVKILDYSSFGARQNQPRPDQLANQSCNCSITRSSFFPDQLTEDSMACESGWPSCIARSKAKPSGLSRLKKTTFSCRCTAR